ncbi:LacI family DNA-binding transcriptional regulator [Umezawaea sp. Da 62-37]|uniref:LacI family DNA-binding transcriptional regulator n=1 Tax=Umezawaea sp. Da 62-37 TaxID=3075927 RepID=UPI0028F6FC24|nr:LacI family DNA-binding transcriptional regulator [Umezawaea sp. Da 62-37]WNV85141.1 LacI family DNA-binding transcriptional regulator [Umezawaea sp. Da 62-37]
MTAVGDEGAGGQRGDISVTRIAELAGVTASTVSKVIHGRSGVSDGTRQRVERIIRENGYQRQEKVDAVPIVEVVFQALDSLWALEIIRGVEQVVRPHGLAVTLTEMRGEHTPESLWARQMLARRPVGVIAVSADLSEAQHAQLASRSIPLVALDPTGEPLHPIPSVGATNWAGGLAAARHLLELGHQRIAMINGPGEFLCCRARVDGYRAALDAAGVPLDPELLRAGPFYFETGRDQARELLRLPDPPTAIFAANDLQAFGVYDAARTAGVRVPDDLSVIGFDDLAFTQWSEPPLTTVRQPLLEMGAKAAGFVLDLAAGRQPEADRVELPTKLVVRRSTAPPRVR